ncbi:MAG: amino acid permease, partial [Clostridium sp.]
MAEDKKLRWYNLSLMAFVMVWGFGNVVNNFANQGLQVVVSWVLIIGLYFVPYALMVGELGSVFKEGKGGVSTWIRETSTPTLAYFAGWTYWVVHIPYLAQKPQNVLVGLGWIFKGNGDLIKTLSPMTAQLITLGIFLFFVWVSLKGMNSLKIIGTVAGTATFIMSILYILMMIAAPALRGVQIATTDIS